MNKNITLLVIISSLYASSLSACPIIIKNDSRDPIIVIDPNNNQSIYVKAGREQMINPSLTGWFDRTLATIGMKHETLDIHIKAESNVFSRTYQVKEQYCASETPTLKLSEIEMFAQEPTTDRYQVTTFKTMVAAEHDHSDHEH